MFDASVKSQDLSGFRRLEQGLSEERIRQKSQDLSGFVKYGPVDEDYEASAKYDQPLFDQPPAHFALTPASRAGAIADGSTHSRPPPEQVRSFCTHADAVVTPEDESVGELRQPLLSGSGKKRPAAPPRMQTQIGFDPALFNHHILQQAQQKTKASPSTPTATFTGAAAGAGAGRATTATAMHLDSAAVLAEQQRAHSQRQLLALLAEQQKGETIGARDPTHPEYDPRRDPAPQYGLEGLGAAAEAREESAK